MEKFCGNSEKKQKQFLYSLNQKTAKKQPKNRKKTGQKNKGKTKPV
ncbi:MAG: hypothetical protein ABIJ74_00875 [archaeon]